MKVLMIVPAALPIAGVALASNLLLGSGVNVWFDMQANVVDLDMRRYVVEHQIPGREGGKLQDLGAACSTLSISGKWIFENPSNDDLLNVVPWLKGVKGIGWNWIKAQTMQMVYRLKTPVFLACDLITTAVLVERFRLNQRGGEPNVINYSMSFKEIDPIWTAGGLVAMIGAVGVTAVTGGDLELGY